MWEKLRVPVISLILLIIMLGGVLVWNKIIDKKEKTTEPTFVDVSDANNVPSVDKKLGNEDVAITESYLRSYTINKSATWYQSSGIVKSIKYKGKEAIISLRDNDNNVIEATISKSDCKVKKNDKVNFVGVISIKNSNLILSKISKEEFSYSNSISITIKELKENISNIKSTYFVINGYMVTEKDKFKLYDNKEDYLNESSGYFVINWQDKFMYTGNQNVKVRCKLADTNVLNSCTLIEK